MNAAKLLWLSAGLTLACGQPADNQAAKPPSTATLFELDLRAALPEQGTSFFGQQEPGLADVLLRLDELSQEPLATGLFVRLGPQEGHFGDVEDLAQAFEAFRAQKRPVHCHFEELDNAGYALAAHCDRLTMSPAGMLNLVGIGAQVVHGKRLLDMLGVRAELLQMGQYKGAAEPFTREDLSPALRESLEGLLDDLDTAFRAHLSARGGRDRAAWKAVIDQGPYSANKAKAQDLVDALAYDDAARAKAKAASQARVVRPVFEKKDAQGLTLRELFQALSGPDRRRAPEQPHLALAYVTGEIVENQEPVLERTASDPFIKTLRKWGDDRRIRAVVLRVESPGGSALASDRMWHAVRRVAGRKPVVVSLGDMAASGGYYVASAGSHIVAAPGGVFGSIGVVGGKFVVEELATRAGVQVHSLKRGAHAAWLSPFSSFTPGERQRFEALLRETYDRFLERVSLGRKRSVEELLKAAEGRVMGAERARTLGLVDETGGLSRALQVARERGKLGPRAPVVTWPDEHDVMRALSNLISAKHGAHALDATVADVLRAARPLTTSPLITVLAGAGEAVAATPPYVLRIH